MSRRAKGMKIADVKVGEEYAATIAYGTTTRVRVIDIEKVAENGWSDRKVRTPLVEVVDHLERDPRRGGRHFEKGERRHVPARDFLGPWADVAERIERQAALTADVDDAVETLTEALDAAFSDSRAYRVSDRSGGRVQAVLTPDEARALADMVAYCNEQSFEREASA